MKRIRLRLLVGAAAVSALVVLGGVAAFAVAGSHHAPGELALGTAQPGGSASALAGRWAVGPGSLAGYRVKEQFIDQPAETEAVARTSDVTGTMVVAISGDTVRVSSLKVEVNLATLTSQDSYATYQVYQRDFFIRTIYLQTDRYPTAAFTAGAFTFPLLSIGPLVLDVRGKLSVHGVTRDVTAHVQAQDGTTQAEVAGAMSVDMRDFAIEPPDISFTRAEPQVTIEFDLKLVRA